MALETRARTAADSVRRCVEDLYPDAAALGRAGGARPAAALPADDEEFWRTVRALPARPRSSPCITWRTTHRG